MHPKDESQSYQFNGLGYNMGNWLYCIFPFNMRPYVCWFVVKFAWTSYFLGVSLCLPLWIGYLRGGSDRTYSIVSCIFSIPCLMMRLKKMSCFDCVLCVFYTLFTPNIDCDIIHYIHWRYNVASSVAYHVKIYWEKNCALLLF